MQRKSMRGGLASKGGGDEGINIRKDNSDYTIGNKVTFAGFVHMCLVDGTSAGAEPTVIALLGASDVVVNGRFDTDTVWGKGTGWTIAGGVANHAAGSAANLTQTSIITIGKSFLITNDILNLVAGVFKVYAGVGAPGSNMGANGTYSEVLTAAGDTTLYIQAAGVTSEADIDNISVIEVTKDGTAAWRTIGYA